MPRLSIHPIPKTRFHGGRWRIYWKWNFKQYSIATGHADQKKTTAVNVDLRLFSAALAMDRPVFPEEYQDAPGVIAYMQARFPENNDDNTPLDASSWLDDYAKEIKGECSPRWAEMSVIRLRALDKDVGGIATLTAEGASKYLADIAAKRKAGTRNRLLATFSRFFKWAVRTERMKVNPFAGIKTLKEERLSDIVYCTPIERDEAIALAQATEWPEWLAIPIACYAGMRREEIANLLWPDIRFEAGLIVVTKTKTRKSRTIPLNSTLERYLRAVPEAQRTGHVVKCPPGIDRLWRMDNMMRKVQKQKKAAMLAALCVERPSPSRSKEYKAKRAAYEVEKQKQAASIEAALERLGWNAWRHTFGSLLAQGGISLDKISAWMGNTPEVCRRHYAQFIPRDRRDEEIDIL